MICEMVINNGNREWYRGQLAADVAGIKCIYAGSFAGSPTTAEQRMLITGTAAPGQIGTVECYANGAINAFVHADGRQIGFVRGRPSAE